MAKTQHNDIVIDDNQNSLLLRVLNKERLPGRTTQGDAAGDKETASWSSTRQLLRGNLGGFSWVS